METIIVLDPTGTTTGASPSDHLTAAMPVIPATHDLEQVEASLAVAATAVAAAAAMTAVTAATATTMLPELVVALETYQEQKTLLLDETHHHHHQQEQPFKGLLQDDSFCVSVSFDSGDANALEETLRQLDQLIALCSAEGSVDHVHEGRAPGFWTKDQPEDLGWNSNKVLPAYQTMNCTGTTNNNNQDLPLPSLATAKRVYVKVREALQLRLDFLRSSNGQTEDYCSCIAIWKKDVVAVQHIINQVIEQALTEEASDYLNDASNFDLRAWNYDHYSNKKENNSTTSAIPTLPLYSTPMKFISHRDQYMSILVDALLGAKHSVIISTCYLFYSDPAQLYLLLDVLPHIVKRGVKVHFLMDLFVFEGQMLMSPFRVTSNNNNKTVTTNTATAADEVTLTSFLDKLPPHSPPCSHAKFQSQYHLFEALLKLSSSASSCGPQSSSSSSPTSSGVGVGGSFELRFWCARDSMSGYRIKNHSKGVVVDNEWAIFGGSNLTPTLTSAKSDLDCVVVGEAAKAVGDTFWNLWESLDGSTTTAAAAEAMMTTTTHTSSRPSRTSSHVPNNNNPQEGSIMTTTTHNDKRGSGCDSLMTILRSTPSSKGEDCIYRVVLQRLEAAQDSIILSTGHINFPQSFVEALERAANRGVNTIQLLVNSYHSSDLRIGQRDLFLSIQRLLQQVPSVQVYATHGSHAEFLHGKYVIVDSSWVALGSWNLWTRSAFYELELEAFVESSEVASILQTKFDTDKTKNAVLVELDDCDHGAKFCPKGCPLCRHFGPFFVPTNQCN